jgi:hypothetical protein
MRDGVALVAAGVKVAVEGIEAGMPRRGAEADEPENSTEEPAARVEHAYKATALVHAASTTGLRASARATRSPDPPAPGVRARS